MAQNERALLAAQRITSAASFRGVSINKLLTDAGVSKSVVDRMKTGIMPSADKLEAVASALDVPMGYLLGTGPFERWDLILEHRGAVLAEIAKMMDSLAQAILGGVDDLALARLVEVFRVDIEMGHDPCGLELGVTAPIPTMSAETKKGPALGMSENGLEMLALYERLPERDQLLLLGRLQEMTAPLVGGAGEPPAAASSDAKAG